MDREKARDPAHETRERPPCPSKIGGERFHWQMGVQHANKYTLTWAQREDHKRLPALFAERWNYHVVSDIELTPIDRVNECYERILQSDVRYRFVIDIATLEPA